MHSKQVRRRRAVVAALVAISIALLTAYFGGSADSPLHSLQRGVVEVFSPIQEGASKALAPFRDIAGFFSNTFNAKSQVAQLRRQVQYYERLAAQYRADAIENQQLSREVGLDNANSIDSYKPVAADVIGRDPNLWYETIEVDKGSDDGVRTGDPVTGDGALVGAVTAVGSTYSIVTLITDHTMAVAAQVEDTDPNGDSGVLVPAVGNPNQLELQYLPTNANIQQGQQVVTVGFRYGSLEDLYPAGIPIGHVSAVGNDLPNNGQVQVAPAADLRHVNVVQVLTTPHAGTERAQLP